jgi:hypothetical protein
LRHAPYEIGEFWARDAQIDVVGLPGDGRVDLGECRRGAVRSAAAVEREIRERAAHWAGRGDPTVQLRVFSGTTRAPRGALPPDLRWHDLADLYGEGC